ncbi:acylpyruvate hydrolase [Cryptococcus wingfieldii CBS 7118]|uniref:Acylpyruvate hydrolase n=1 Tax=Cryptococcus wingfieldii CBS 7118 TaxID=1295528 RepID=A0A1E3K6B9_9TREE|nr:acylpyruvate hydrolase [Cryptococcus wingfieldii CBS 7118]ODO08690.1 acylpyruvate hydrolase [Cryptococcus wingfieldii CBS 7118]
MSNFVKTGRKIVAIGRNYADHAKELGNAVPKEPFFFLKPTSSYLVAGSGPVEIPHNVKMHHEVELGVVIGKDGRDIPASAALDHIAGYTLALDMTARNIQDKVKSKGLPWSTAKGFDTFTPVGPFIPKHFLPDLAQVGLHFTVNGTVKQSGITADMIFDIPHLISFVSSIMRLEEGDLLLTGTPKGVGQIVGGETFAAKLTYPGVDGEVISEYEGQAVDRVGGYQFEE